MSNTIIELRHSYVTGNVPSSLANGEIAINTYDGKVFYRGGASNTIQTIERFQGPAGLNGEIQFNDSGVLGSASNLTFDKLAGLFRTGNVTANTITTRDYVQFGDGTRQYTANAGSGGGGTDQWVRDTANASFTAANSAGIYANSAFNHANAAFIKANTGGALTVSLTDDSNNFTNVVTSVTGIRFDANSGFDITNLGSGNVKVGMNSTFKTWKITGQSDLIANGLDTIEFVGSNGVVLTSNTLASPKTITFDTSQIFGVANTANTVYVSDVPPNYPKTNTLWWQSNTATLKIYYNDGVTSQWVDTNQTYAVDNVARTSANSAFIHANAAFNAANSAADTWVRNQANSAFNQANAAFTVANSAFTTANGTIAWNTANAAFDAANSAAIAANTPSYTANSASIYANGAFAKANTQDAINLTQNNSITAAFIRANNSLDANNGGTVTGTITATSFITTGSYGNIQGANIIYANTFVANTGFIQFADGSKQYTANAGSDQYARNTANAAFETANNEAGVNLSQNTTIEASFSHANSAFNTANNEAGVNLTQNNSITASFVAANSAGVYANGAFARANNSISANTGGTITGDLSITGNLSVLGNTFTVSSTTIIANDTVIILGANNYTSDLLDIGFAAHYNDSANAHTGLIRDHGTKEWQLFEGYTPEISANNDININDPSFKIATLNANVHATQILVKGINLLPYVNSSFSLANSNYTSAVTKLDVTNSGASAYLIDQYSGNNPTIYVRAGETIAFNLNVAGHPFLIRESNGGANTSAGLIHVSTTGVVSTGSSAQGQVTGVLYWKIPFGIVGSTYVYQCGIHAGMVGNIVIEQPTILAFNQANASFNVANSAAIAANTPSHVANSAAIYANGAFFAANTEAAVNATQNTTIQLAWNHANSAYNQANNGGASVSVGDDPPAAPTANSLWWQSNTGELKIYYNDGTSLQWVDAFSSAYSLDQWARDHANAAFIQANTGGGGASVSVSDSPPLSPAANSLWWQSNTGVLKIYYNDGTSVQWVDSSTSTYSLDQSARNIANSAYNHANAAFNAANTGGGGGGTPVTISTFQETANGTVSTFDLGFSPASGQILIVSIDGIVQPVTTYTVDPSANTISFTTGPISGEVVYVVGFSNTSAYVINDGSVTYAKLSSSAISTIEGNAIALSIALG